MDVYNAIDHAVPADAENKLELELSNGSRIMALPGTEATVRGLSSVRCLVIDEASRVDDALYGAIRPMLAVSGGRLVALSTPFGKRGWWYEAWESKLPWERIKITALDCPRISPEFLQEERETHSDLFYRSEYLCQFVDTVFATDLVMAALSDDIQPLMRGAHA